MKKTLDLESRLGTHHPQILFNKHRVPNDSMYKRFKTICDGLEGLYSADCVWGKLS